MFTRETMFIVDYQRNGSKARAKSYQPHSESSGHVAPFNATWLRPKEEYGTKEKIFCSSSQKLDRRKSKTEQDSQVPKIPELISTIWLIGK